MIVPADRSPGPLARMRARMSGHPLRSASLFVLLFFLIDWTLIDKWVVHGHLVDAETGAPIPGAWVMADFRGEEPLVVFPAPTHPPSRTEACMGTRAVRTDQLGAFRISVFTWNRPLADKSVYVMGFTPGRLVLVEDVAIGTSILSEGPKIRMAMGSGPGETRFTTVNREGDPALRLPQSERGYSDELFSTLRVLAHQACEPQFALQMKEVAMKHAIGIAKTFDERERVRRWCRTVRFDSNLEAKRASTVFQWPFDCENLPFKHQPSPEVLAVEAELEAKRKAAAEHNSSAAVSATTDTTHQ